MNRLRLIRRPRTEKPSPRCGPWGSLAEPVYPEDTDTRIRAQSLLCGVVYRDGSTNPDTLTLEQARDVLAWRRVL